jgi:hypothetical protein
MDMFIFVNISTYHYYIFFDYWNNELAEFLEVKMYVSFLLNFMMILFE